MTLPATVDSHDLRAITNGETDQHHGLTTDGVIDLSDWFVAQGDHDAASLALFSDDAAMLLGRKIFEGSPGSCRRNRGP